MTRAVVVDEAALVLAPDLGDQAGVVGHRAPALAHELLGGLLGALARQAVDDARVAVGLARRKRTSCARRVGLGRDLVADVGAIEAADEERARRRGRAAAISRRVGGSAVAVSAMRGTCGTALAQHGELEILGAEVVAPLRDAVRLVDREQRERQRSSQARKPSVEQPLRRDVEQVERARRGLAAHPACSAGARLEFRNSARMPSWRSASHLVLHQRDQRADDDRGAGAQRAPAAGSTSDLPLPVGITTSASPPPTTQRTIASCWPRNEAKPNTSCRHRKRICSAGSRHQADLS